MEDIEDCVGPEHAIQPQRKRSTLLPRALRPRRRQAHAAEASLEAVETESFVPGTQRVYIKTWGCSHNTSDGEYMAGLLAAAGYSITGKPRPPLANSDPSRAIFDL